MPTVFSSCVNSAVSRVLVDRSGLPVLFRVVTACTIRDDGAELAPRGSRCSYLFHASSQGRDVPGPDEKCHELLKHGFLYISYDDPNFRQESI